MKRISNFIPTFFVVFAVFHFSDLNAQPFDKRASKSVSKSKSLKMPPLRQPAEYRLLEKIKKETNLSKLTVQQIQSHQRELKNLEWTSTNKTFEKEIEDLFWYLEIVRAEKQGGTAALNAWMKALSSLNQFKWIYGWTETTSKSLVSICKKSKPAKTFAQKQIEEKCAYLSKKVNDAFPKGALETQSLKELIAEQNGAIDAVTDRFDRLGQSYTEKTEKDEDEFVEVLDHYLNHRDSDLYRTGKTFIETYPKSMLRFRTLFLIAERQFANGDKKEAEKNYLQIINQVPYGYYSIVSSERLGLSLPEKLEKAPLAPLEDLSDAKLTLMEKDALCRVENLVQLKKQEPVSIELEQFSRIRSYPTTFLIHLLKQANQSGQDLAGFRFATEILQRKGEAPLNAGFVDLIFPDRFQKEIAQQASLSKIDPLLVISLMKQESGFKRSILSSSGAVGLMQLMPFTALEVQKDLYLRNLREPAKNIEVGTKYLASLLNEKFNGNVVYALAGYNAGPHRVGKWKKEVKTDWGMQEFIESIPYKETRDYVMSILRNRYWYQYRKGMKPQSVFEAWRSP